MGYHVSYGFSEVVIPVVNVPDALSAAVDLFRRLDGEHQMTHDLEESLAEPTDAKRLAELLGRFEYLETEEKADGSLEIIGWETDKQGDEEQVFFALGPYAKAGGLIEAVGEDDARWGYRYTGEACLGLDAQTVYSTLEERERLQEAAVGIMNALGDKEMDSERGILEHFLIELRILKPTAA